MFGKINMPNAHHSKNAKMLGISLAGEAFCIVACVLKLFV
jgi:hypothetical protein